MKWRLIAPTAGLIMGLAANAWAGLSLSQDRIDFGEMKEGIKAEKIIVLTNTGTGDLKIANVTTSWSCTTTALGQRELKAGQKANLKIVYNTWKFPGKFEKYVTVFTGPDGKTKHIITMVGHVNKVPMGEVEVKPRKVEVGDLPVGRVTTKELKIVNSGDAAMSLTKVASKKFKTVYFDAEKAGAPLEVKAGGEAVIKMELKPKKAGRYLDFVMIHGEARNITEKGYKVVVVGQGK